MVFENGPIEVRNSDFVLAQNYLQHADHYLRRFNELNERKENSLEKTKIEEKSIASGSILEKEDTSKTAN